MAHDALFRRDDGTENAPQDRSAWAGWVSAGRTRNWCKDDPLLDWLAEYGEAKGFVRDDQLEGYDERTDFLQFLFARGRAFEAAVIAWLEDHHEVAQIASGPADARSADAAEATWRAMRAGVEIITQAPLRNPENDTYGIADLLVRSDLFAHRFPDYLLPAELHRSAPDLGGSPWHYRVVEVKYTTLRLLAGGHAAGKHLEFMAQLHVYNQALGRLQGFTPPCAYVLGRGWQDHEGNRGHSALDRLARVDAVRELSGGQTLSDLVRDACRWVRRVRAHGREWDVLPEPTRPELRPNLANTRDQPWHTAKRHIAIELEDPALLPRVSPSKRREALAKGVARWTDPACTADVFGVRGPKTGPLLDAVIRANHSLPDGPIVFPTRVEANEPRWREPAGVEFFVDFETVNDLDDDFSRFPERGGHPLIFMVGCGHVDEQGDWAFEVFTADRLVEPEERRVLEDWLRHMSACCVARGCSLADARIFHWAPAERSTLTTAYNSAAVRHGLPHGDHLPWVDLLTEVVRSEPVTVRGAFGFGLKAIAKAFHAHGLIPTVWGDGPTDGLGAMVGAWHCDEVEGRTGAPMRRHDLMKEIEAYNEVDCRVMWDILSWLRAHR